MKTRPGQKINIKSVEELLGVVNEESAMDIEIYKITGFAGHPFKVVDDEKMQELVDSIKENGVLSPVLIRPKGMDTYDMNQKQPEPTKIALDELQSKYPLLDFLVKKEVKTISHEMEVSIKAGDIVGLIYDAFLKQYRIPDIKEKDETAEQKIKREHKLKSLNALCVRIVFCLYAEDAGIFGKRNMFHDYLEA